MKTVYIICFIIFGFLLQFLIHATIEIWYLNLLLSDFRRYGLGLPWSDWSLIHDVFSMVLIILGVGFGYSQGKLWWNRIYEPPSETETG